MKITKQQLKQIIKEELEVILSDAEAREFFGETAFEGGVLGEKKDENWIQDAEEDIERRGTEGVCTGDKFGSESCPPGSKRYNLAKTFRKMAKKRKKG